MRLKFTFSFLLFLATSTLLSQEIISSGSYSSSSIGMGTDENGKPKEGRFVSIPTIVTNGDPSVNSTKKVGSVTSSANTCATAVASGSILINTCSEIGTPSFSGPLIDVDPGTAQGTPPSGGNPTCGNYGTGGGQNGDNNTWFSFDIQPGVTGFNLQWNTSFGPGVGAGFGDLYASVYTGTSCAALTHRKCGVVVNKSGASYLIYDFAVNNLGITPPTKVYILFWADGDKNWANFGFSVNGWGTVPTNTACALALPVATNTLGCNVGASGASFTTPGAAGVPCTGGNWGSNENTVFYSITPTSSTATLNITNTTCNSGTSGTAQFGLWSSCAAVGTYGANFKGCAVGTSALSISGLTAGSTYILAVDGTAGALCTWNFSGTNLVLPIELLSFTASDAGNSVALKWSTASEKNNNYFDVERSIDGVSFYSIGTVKGAGNSEVRRDYSFIDNSPASGLAYYRLKQVDFDGDFGYSKMEVVDFKKDINLNFELIPNPQDESQFASLQLNFIPKKLITITVSDLNGKILYEENKKLESNQIQIPSQFSKGLYIVNVMNEEFNQTKRLIIK